MYQLAKVIGSKEQLGANMRNVERINQPDPLAAAVFAQIQSIVADEPVSANTADPVIRHVSVEEAMRELIEMQRFSAQCAPSASQ